MGIRDTILSAVDTKIEPADCPEWGQGIFVRTMTGQQRAAFESMVYIDGKPSTENFYSNLLTQTLCDEQGNLIFTPADAPALSAKSAVVLARLGERAAKLNRITSDAATETKKN